MHASAGLITGVHDPSDIRLRDGSLLLFATGVGGTGLVVRTLNSAAMGWAAAPPLYPATDGQCYPRPWLAELQPVNCTGQMCAPSIAKQAQPYRPCLFMCPSDPGP